MKKTPDILIVGAGPAGLSFARLLAPTGLQICLIEKTTEKELAAPPYDGRETALTHLSYRLMTEAGIWDHLPQQEIGLIRDAKVLNGSSSYALHFDHRESGKDHLGFMVSNYRIRRAAYLAAKACKNVHFLTGVEVTDAGVQNEKAWVKLSNGKELSASLLVAADSRFSKLRSIMRIETSTLDFDRMCIVSRVSHQKPHHETAYECFYKDKTMAVLPLSGNASSIVITISTERQNEILGLSPAAFAEEVSRKIKHCLGEMKLESKLFAYPLVGVYAKRFYADRFALLGDAAVGMHPVTAHGFNLGLKGAATLAAQMKKALSLGGDIGSATVLKAYHRQHVRATKPLYLGTNALVALYTNTRPAAMFARQTLLILGNKLSLARKIITNQLTQAR